MKALLTAALLATTALPALAFDPAAMTEAEKAAFDQAVHDYIMANPEVLIEAVNSLEDKRMAQQTENDRALVAANSAAIFASAADWTGGNPEGDVTMVEFIDYRCSVCRRVNPMVEATVKNDGKLRWVIKEFPILGQESDLASRFAVAVKQMAGMDAYKKVHDALYAMRGAVTVESLTAMAKDQGLDADAVIGRMNTEEVSAELRENAMLAERMGIAGTPTFVIGDGKGGEMLRGMPQTGLESTIAAAREAAKG